MGRPSTTGSRLNLGEPWNSKLADFCTIHYGVDGVKVIREALDEHIDRRLAQEPALRRRFDEERRKRLAAPTNPQLTVVKKK